MKAVSISGSLRENVGKKDAKKHRREGKVPCVLYGGPDDCNLSKIGRNSKVKTKVGRGITVF